MAPGGTADRSFRASSRTFATLESDRRRHACQEWTRGDGCDLCHCDARGDGCAGHRWRKGQVHDRAGSGWRKGQACPGAGCGCRRGQVRGCACFTRALPRDRRRLQRLPHVRLRAVRREGARGAVASGGRRRRLPGPVGHDLRAEPAQGRGLDDRSRLGGVRPRAQVAATDAVVHAQPVEGSRFACAVSLHRPARAARRSSDRVRSPDVAPKGPVIQWPAPPK